MAERRGARAVLGGCKIAAAAAGDQRAWDALVERYSQQVWDVTRSYGLDLADHLTDVEEDEVGPWLCAVADNEARRVAEVRLDASAPAV